LLPFLFLFLEFIKCVCGLIWMCCEGGVACYVECTNVVKKWQRSDCDNRDYQGRRCCVFKRQKYHAAVKPCRNFSEREEELLEFIFRRISSWYVVPCSGMVWFWVYYVATQLALQLQQERIQVVRSTKVVRRIIPTESNGTPTIDTFQWNRSYS